MKSFILGSLLKANVKYQIVKMVKNGTTQSPIDSLDELDLVDKNGDAIKQRWLNDIISHMNGEKDIGDPSVGTIFSGRSLGHTLVIRQSAMTKADKTFDDDDMPETQKRECVRATCMLEKDVLHQMMIAGRLGTANKLGF